MGCWVGSSVKTGPWQPPFSAAVGRSAQRGRDWAGLDFGRCPLEDLGGYWGHQRSLRLGGNP
jgi:hypothetical protein